MKQDLTRDENVQYKIIIEQPLKTVVSQYRSTYQPKGAKETERELENKLMEILEGNGYERADIKNSQSLLKNLRRQIEKLNDFEFSDKQWQEFFDEYINNKNDDIIKKTSKIQEDSFYALRLENNKTKNIYLIDKRNIHRNHLQIINQYQEHGKNNDRYDVTILVNGLPLAHIELKRRGVAIKEAFNQIDRYQNESFDQEYRLFEYVQIFVISNGAHTKYYSNTTRKNHIKNSFERKTSQNAKISDTFEFTSWWTDAENSRIAELTDFAQTFLSKHTLLNVLTKYCVFTTKNKLLVMRPYQIAATESIINKIRMSINLKQYGKEAGGYIWHTTGSGKTLTSFKTAQLATAISEIDKVLFVVDRKDLDYQTMKEYNKYQKDSANSSASTKVLATNMEDPKAKIIITTIQKLDRFISLHKKNKDKKENDDRRFVIIFDECHRSQFGQMRDNITKAFKKHYLFGFTGTPIFPPRNLKKQKDENLIKQTQGMIKTTEYIFGRQLHAYTIVDAINDGNVLPFRVDYVDGIIKADREAAKKNKAKLFTKDDKRISEIVKYIIKHFDQKTCRNERQEARDEKSIIGFNSLFAAESIEAAKLYYKEFQKQMADLKAEQRLKVGIIFSQAVQQEQAGGFVQDENMETENLDPVNLNFLKEAIADYNKMFKSNYCAESDSFQSYYKDISQKVKDKQLDILIVVNMFLTGFDAPQLNTLWADKNLYQHGLMQAFSRTNRILNSVKTFGNIVLFRDLQKEVDESIAEFGDKNARSVVLLNSYQDYYESGWMENGIKQKGYKELVDEIQEKYSLPNCKIVGEKKEKEFIQLFGEILKRKNILNAFDQFDGQEILSEKEFQDYKSEYLDLHDNYVGTAKSQEKNKKENIYDGIVFEMELIRQVDIDIDYILNVVAKRHEDGQHIDINDDSNFIRIINSSANLRPIKDLVLKFLGEIKADSNNEQARDLVLKGIGAAGNGGDIKEKWNKFIDREKNKEIDGIIEADNLDAQKAKSFMDRCLKRGCLLMIGVDFAEIFPPKDIFNPNSQKETQKIKDKLSAFFERYNRA
ncbi:MAG: type I restriction endonuclease subunit R [Elusimicrobiota bacterium]|jgi:type I restriction enzyme R subunit|nr:type I restriction endonuclease subunit R [Elusimicrobiota bacterium]